MLMNFTEAIRKSNLAKQEVLKTRENILKTKTTAEDIKTALVEQGINIADVSFDDIAQFIRENNIGANDSWERPKEWLALPKVVAEESKYTDKVVFPSESAPLQSAQSLDDNKVVAQDLSRFQQYLENMTNLSEISTGMQDGVFNVSVNDFAYEMLCKVEENSDNLLLFEGASLVDEPFTNLSSYEQSNFLTDLFIQIDDEEPLNLTQLAKGEINLPTEGKYKNIAIINQKTLTESSVIPGTVSVQEVTNKGIVLNGVRAAITKKDCYPLSLLISLDYNCFDDNVKMKNGDKQCIIKIWGNGFIRLTPYRSFLFDCYSVLNVAEDIPALVKANDCILDVSVCDSDIDAAFYMTYDTGTSSVRDTFPIVQPYLPITLECLLIGFGDFTKKITFISSLKPEFFMKLPCMKQFIFPPYVQGTLNGDGSNGGMACNMTSLNDFNFYMNIKEIDCSSVRYYNDYTSMMSFLLSTPDDPLLNIHSMAGKIKNVENIIFPNFKTDIQDNNHCVMVDVDGFSSNPLIASSIIPYCFNLSAFKALKREAVVDLINKLPFLDVDINNETITNAKYIPPLLISSPQGLDANDDTKEIKDNTNNSLASISSDSFLLIQKIDNIVGISEDKQCFNGNQELVNEYLLKYYSLDSNINNSLAIRINKESSLEEDMFLDKKWFHSVLVSPFTFKQLTNEDIQLAADKGWRIVNGVNYPVALLPSWNEK